MAEPRHRTGGAVAALRRHDLLVLDPTAWTAALAGTPHAADDLVAGWAAAGFPAMVRRRTPDEPSGVPVGVPLPPARGKARIALILPEAATIERRPPLRLVEAADRAPPAWASALDALMLAGDAHGSMPRCFGSLLWQHLTGLAYLTPSSDIDVIWPIGEATDRMGLLRAIEEIDRAGPVRIDGEFVFASGEAVNWRELVRSRSEPGAGEVLVKAMDGVRIAPAGELL
ncbi:malonate decarboxylase holo-[acyl-carrier-protein] synthase [Segnochrobactrum spirostomi]|uniref:Malonate decarboxylase holo-[acyl-carrier-protein] synthase n=1 Tax=Segnochrobactrum spirostomi TaxID=2608987 RepID=A0A6A7Y6A9_9HYPH|nr:malonate decarboxylase holo-[acyl-carrier-protein] synthase [Segnochrobactrum spirostomi]MQT14830.1 malonate decarboxylase holo-[acyl-carrier-protein] synthase [Segnochrobactrum spirostomi]